MKRNSRILRLLSPALLYLAAGLLFQGPAAKAQTFPPGLVSWWRGDGDANDAVGGSHGALHGATLVPGKVGQAFSFDGVDDDVGIVKMPSLNMGPGDFSIETWVKFTGSVSSIIFINYAGVPSYWLGVTADAKAQVGFRPGSAITGGANDPYAAATGTKSLSDGQWHHVVGLRSGAAALIYVDGVLEDAVTNLAVLSVEGGSVNTGGCSYARLGATHSSTGHCSSPTSNPLENHFKGLIDEVKIYNRALTAGEIQAAASGTSTTTPTCDLSVLESEINSRASQVSVNTVQATLDNKLNDTVASRASQATADAIMTKVDSLDLSRLDVPVSTRATQASVNSVQTTLDAKLNDTIASRAAQATADAIKTKVDSLDLSRLDVAVSTRASQSGVTDLKTDVATVSGKLDLRLDERVSTRASQTSVDGIKARLDTFDLARVDATVSSRASQSSVDSLSVKTDTNEAKAEEFRDSSLRAFIEADLAVAAQRERIALFYLPGTVGGQLEFVRDIVADNILLHKTTGLSVGKAEAEFTKGNDAYTKKQYRQAYDQYRKAYLEMIR